jgi:hypothetical protein
LRACYAALVEKCSFEEIANLTDRQIMQIYFHPRDKYGAVASVEEIPDKTLDDKLHQIDILAHSYHLKPELVEDMKQKMREKWQNIQTPPTD